MLKVDFVINEIKITSHTAVYNIITHRYQSSFIYFSLCGFSFAEVVMIGRKVKRRKRRRGSQRREW